MKHNLSYSLIFAAALSGCVSTDEIKLDQQNALPTKTDEVTRTVDKKLERPAPTLMPGNDQLIKMPARRASVEMTGDAVALNFEQAPLVEVVHAVMGDILELDYIVEHPINGEVTLRTRNPVPRDQLLVILESLLQANNAYVLRDKQGRYIVSGSSTMSQFRPEFVHPDSRGAGYANVIVPLNYIGATEMAEILRPVADEKAFVRIDPLRNLLVLGGRRNQLDGWLDIVSTFDVDMLKGMSVGMFPLKESSPAEAETALRAILETALGGESGAAQLVRIVPMERLKSLLIISPRAHYLEKVKEWVERIDQTPNDLNERRLIVYSVKNTSASHLAKLISSIYGGVGGGTSGSGITGVAPGLTPTRVGDGDVGQSGMSGTTSTVSGRSGGGTSSFNLGEIRVVADEENNSLLIYASRNEYRRISDALEQLDLLPTQVSIEASILEITLTEELSYGLAWYLNNNLSNGWSGRGGLTVPSRQVSNSSDIGSSVAGLAYSVYNPAGELRSIINALADKSLVNIISTPTITVLDNHQASIQVGNQQPVQSGRSVTDGGVSSTSISYRDTGVVLEVTPSVNAGGMVTMIVKQSITDVGDIEPATGQRPFLKRDISTRVAVRSGEAAVLGGLIRENASNGKTGLPLLSSVPIVGNFFGRTTKTKNRTELLVMITPRVINNEQDFRDITQEMKDRMRNMKLIDSVNKSASDN